MTKAHDNIEKDTSDTVARIKAIKKSSDAEWMIAASAITASWNNKYGKYYKTLQEAKELDAAKTLLTHGGNKCLKCKSVGEKQLEVPDPHKIKTVCEHGHFKRWGK